MADNSIYMLIDKKNVLISAHGNSLRALCKYLFNISDTKINELEIPTGNPLVIEFENNLKVNKAFIFKCRTSFSSYKKFYLWKYFFNNINIRK